MNEHEQLADLFEHGRLMTVRLSKRAHDRYQQSLAYCWGRQDAGDERTKGNVGGLDFAFAKFAALEAEAYERGHCCMLSNTSDQYGRFVASLMGKA